MRLLGDDDILLITNVGKGLRFDELTIELILEVFSTLHNNVGRLPLPGGGRTNRWHPPSASANYRRSPRPPNFKSIRSVPLSA